MTLYLLNYNNYYNRIIKKHDTITDYAPYTLDIIDNINFNPNDGIGTEQIINYVGDMPNYLVVTDANVIISRWFVIESKRTRAQQFHMLLYRDTIADFEDYILDAPIFIEKATLSVTSPLIFNTENMTFNQIKKQEILLHDNSGCPWIVGYYAKNTPDENLRGVVETNNSEKSYDFDIDTPINAWRFNATSTPYYGIISSIDYRVYFRDYVGGLTSQPAYLAFDRYGNFKELIYVNSSDTTLDTSNAYNTSQPKGDIQTGFRNNYERMYQELGNYITINSDDDVRRFLSYNGQIVKDSEGRYFSISIYADGTEELKTFIPAGNLYNTMNNIVKDASNVTGQANSSTYEVVSVRPKYTMTLVELFNLETTWDMTADKFVTDDSPYNIFAIPCGNTTLRYWANAISYSNEDMGFATANSIIKTMGTYLYDIQLLPYCPIAQQTEEPGIVYVHNSEAYSLVTTPSTGEVTPADRPTYILHVPKSRFTKNISVDIPSPTTAIDKKISNECDMYRLCSPNYNGAFEFSVAKNEGVDYFNVDCEYKPFQPYIHVNPNFKGLYGQDFNDARGLICGGDFSLAQIRDEWQTYQIQNKNYQEIFSRQIEHMEVSHKLQRTSDIVGAVVGTVGGVAAGGAAGSMIPFASGAVGAAVGGIASAGAGIADYIVNEKLRREALDYTKDQFGYQLDNIKALPYTLTKVSSFNDNNKYFPFLEYYTCTDVEKEAFRNKLLYNGMSVGVIGTIRDYLQTDPSYIKGKLIRLETLADDFHLVETISKELNQGVFI